MIKKFCTTGTCIPEKNYMVDLSNRIQLIINQYIKSGQYFTINRARQYGKTTLLYLLEKELRKQDYLVLSLSFEAADEYFESLGSLAEGLSLDIEDCLREQNIDEKVLEEWGKPISERFPMRSLGTKISNLCRKCGKKVVLMIDEVDKSSDNQIFLSFLGLLREKYLKCQQGKDVTFHSVILAGVYDIKTLKLKLHPQEESKYNSPWNIAVDFNIDMSFSVNDIQTMIQEYEQEHHTGMDVEEISRILYDYTSGYPYLVSKICQLLDERVSDAQAWTREGILSAVKMLLKESNTLFDDMTKKLLDHPKLKEMLQNILFTGVDFPFKRETPIIDLGVTFGFLKDKNGIVAVSNRIFETQLYDMFLSETAVNNQMYMKVSSDRNQFIVSGMLQMPLVMQKFYEYYAEIVKNSCSGGTPKKGISEYYEDGNIPWLRTQEVVFRDICKTECFITESAVKNSAAKWIPENCVIVAISGATAGRCAINKIPLTTNQHCLNLEVDPEMALYRYVYYCICAKQEELLAKKEGARGDLNSTRILSLQIDLPSIEKQKRIVSILDRFDAICNDLTSGLPAEIEARQKQYEYYRDRLLSFKELN